MINTIFRQKQTGMEDCRPISFIYHVLHSCHLIMRKHVVTRPSRPASASALVRYGELGLKFGAFDVDCRHRTVSKIRSSKLIQDSFDPSSLLL